MSLPRRRRRLKPSSRRRPPRPMTRPAHPGGEPNTVMGVNNQVQGQITLDWSGPAGSRIGTLEIAADGFVTDSSLRNRAINQFILNSSAFPLITFAPTSISGLPNAAAVGQTVQLEISGDLTIREITQPVTFTADLVAAAEARPG